MVLKSRVSSYGMKSQRRTRAGNARGFLLGHQPPIPRAQPGRWPSRPTNPASQARSPASHASPASQFAQPTQPAARWYQPDSPATQPNWPARQRVSRTATLSQRSQPNWTNPAFWTAQSFCLRHQVAVASASRECAKLLQVSSAAQPCGTSKAARQRSPAGRLAGAPA